MAYILRNVKLFAIGGVLGFLLTCVVVFCTKNKHDAGAIGMRVDEKEKEYVFRSEYDIDVDSAVFWKSKNGKMLSVCNAKNSERTVLSSPENASTYGIEILSYFYGNDIVESQKPFDVYLVNNEVWLVCGNAADSSCGKLSIMFNKSDAKVLHMSCN